MGPLAHLALVMVIPQPWMKRLAPFADVDDRTQVLRHFTTWEKALTAVVMFGGLLGVLIGSAGMALMRLGF